MSVVAVVEAECPVWTGHFSLAEISGVCVCVCKVVDRKKIDHLEKKKRRR